MFLVRRSCKTTTTRVRAHWAGIVTALLLGTSAVVSAAQTAEGDGGSRAATASAAKGTGSLRRGRARAKAPAPARPGTRYTTPRSEESLASDLSTMLNARVKRGTWSVMVVSLTRGDTLFAYDAGRSMQPASTMKLFTSVLAFERLGPYYRFKTEVFRQGLISNDGTLIGNLVLRGGGDPSLSSRFIPGDANAPMRALADQVQLTGIKRVTGDIVGDAGAFDSKTVPDGWLSRYLQASYAARVSALSLNGNLLNVVIAPAKGSGAASVSLEPGTTSFAIINGTRTVPGSRGARLTVGRTSTGSIVVRGWIGSKAGARVYVVVVDDPASFATGAFARALADVGVKVGGAIRMGSTPNEAVRVASLESPPLADLAGFMNRESINHFAELIFRDVARFADPQGVGSAAMANALLRDFLLLRVGARSDDVFAADGSGLSTLDRVTARAEVQLLGYAHRAPWSREFHETLPVAGAGRDHEETLRSRMRATPAQGNLHAKTGTTNDVVALSGYVSAQNGEMLAFSFLYNGRDRWNARDTIDTMGATLASFAR